MESGTDSSMGENPRYYKNFTDTETASVALIENLQREELSSIEEAHAYARLFRAS
ncbi:hypothetical protein BsIDN1_72130 [Bacillus safensis]|uniref:Uncharacterized protein n=1 Tax=Bacillus safensis TaxID=561879 RepID=A0A5S9MLB1_BACIA|nr:hypothetical protein BsIDN1_72130 [Bacillus safensis]